VGSAFQLAFFRGDAWTLEVDATGGVLSSGFFGDFDQLGHDELVDVAPTDDSGFLALGSTQTVAGSFEQLVLAKVDVLGQLSWIRHYGDAGFDQDTSLAITGDGCIAFAGFTRQPDTNHDGYLVRTDDQGGRVRRLRFRGPARRPLAHAHRHPLLGLTPRAIAPGATAWTSVAGSATLGDLGVP